MTVPGNLSSPLLATAGAGAAAASVEGPIKSLRFNDPDSAYLSRTPGGGNRKKWTLSFWYKPALQDTSNRRCIIEARNTSGHHSVINFRSTDDKFEIYHYDGSGLQFQVMTTAVFRDPSAWYSFVIAYNTEASGSDKIKIFCNGARITAFDAANYPSDNYEALWNDSGVPHTIGKHDSQYLSGYLADIYFIDGSQLDETSFGAYDDNGVWQAAEYSGTYGTNGYHLLDFANESTIGHDSSGNENDWTANNFSTTAGADNDVLFDVPVNGTQSDTGAGGEVSANYATFNPLDCDNGTLSNGNLTTTKESNSDRFGPQNVTIGVTSGKWYCEIKWDSGTYALIGVTHAQSAGRRSTTWHRDADTYTWYFSGAFMSYLWAYGTSTFPDGTNPTFAVGDTVGVLLDKDNHKLYFTKNGSYVASMNAATGANGIDISRHSSETTFITCGNNSSTASQLTLNAGQRPFANSAPSGYKPLCTTNFPTATVPDGSTAFDITKHTGNGSTQNVTGLSFKPDWVWVKCRNAAQYHRLVDNVRGVNRDLITNGTFTEQNQDSSNSVSSFNSNGFSLGPDGAVNTLNNTYVAWCWDVDAGSNKTYTVKVVSDSGNKYRFDNHGTSAVTLELAEGGTYVFDQSDSSNAGHPLRFSTTSDGTHGGGSEYTTGVTATGTPGSAGAKTTIVLASGAATLYYYCTAHSGMGGQIDTNSLAGSTRLSGSHSSYNQSQTFSTGVSGSGTGGSFPTGEEAAKAFDGNLNTRCRWTGTSSPVLTASFTAISATKLRVRYHAWAQTTSDATDVLISVNGGTYYSATEQNFITYDEVHAADGQAPFIDISPLITNGQVSSVSVKRRSTVSTVTGLTFYAIEIDDKILVDSSVTPPDVPAITARVNVSATQGISIGKYTGNDTRTATVAHDLGAKPDLIIVKAINKSDNWVTYHSAMGASYHGDINLTGGFNSGGSKFASIEPTSTVFSLATDGAVNSSSYNYIFYAFAAVPGYSSFGSYEGNGDADGPFVHTGFRPAMVMVKNADGSGHWVIMDTTRDADNPMEDRLKIDADDDESNTPAWDALSNGFKIRSTYSFSNTNQKTYVYWAMAENPFSANGGLAR